MQIIIHNTNRIVDVNDGAFKARVWEGMTDTGIPVFCLVARVAVAVENDQSAFQKELQETMPPSPESWRAIPARIVL